MAATNHSIRLTARKAGWSPFVGLLVVCLALTTEAGAAGVAPGTILAAAPGEFSAPIVYAIDPVTGRDRAIIARLCRSTTTLGLGIPPDVLRTDNVVLTNQFGVYRLNTATAALAVIAKRILPEDVESGPFGMPVVGHSDGTLRRIDLVTGAQATLVTLPDEILPHYQFAFASNGDLYVAARNGITRFRVGTGTPSSVLKPPAGQEFYATDLAVAPYGDLFVLQTYPSRILRVDPATGTQTLVSAGGEFVVLRDLVVGPTGDLLVAGTFGPRGEEGIMRVDPATGAQSYVAHLSGGVHQLAFEPGGTLLATKSSSIVRVDLATGTQTRVVPGMHNGYFYLVVAPDGAVLTSTNRTFARADVATGAVSLLSPTAPTVQGVAVTSEGDILVAHGPAGILRAAGGSGPLRELAAGSPLVSPVAVAIAPDGDVVAVDPGAAGGQGAVIRVNPGTGAQRIVSSGGEFRRLTGVAVAPSGVIFVTDADASGGAGGVIRVNPATGEQTIVSAGGDFSSPAAIAIHLDSELVVADPDARAGTGAIIRVNAETGAQSVLAAGRRFVGLAIVPRRKGSVTTTTTLPGATPPPGESAEICDNCVDDNGDGLIDYEDPACCSSTTRLRGRWKTSGKGQRRFHLSAVLPANGTDPRTDTITVLVPGATPPLRCNVLDPHGWRKVSHGFLFPETKALQGIKAARLRLRRDGSVKLTAVTRKGLVARLRDPMLTATIHVGGRCATGSIRFTGKGRPQPARPACAGRPGCLRQAVHQAG